MFKINFSEKKDCDELFSNYEDEPMVENPSQKSVKSDVPRLENCQLPTNVVPENLEKSSEQLLIVYPKATVTEIINIDTDTDEEQIDNEDFSVSDEDAGYSPSKEMGTNNSSSEEEDTHSRTSSNSTAVKVEKEPKNVRNLFYKSQNY